MAQLSRQKLSASPRQTYNAQAACLRPQPFSPEIRHYHKSAENSNPTGYPHFNSQTTTQNAPTHCAYPFPFDVENFLFRANYMIFLLSNQERELVAE
jgi:hypothetical protein